MGKLHVGIVIEDVLLVLHLVFRQSALYIDVVRLRQFRRRDINSSLSGLSGGNDNRHVAATDIACRHRFAAFRTEIIKAGIPFAGDEKMLLVTTDIPCEIPRYRNLALRLFTQRHTDSIADAVGKQRTDAHGAFDTAVFTLAGLRDTEMERIVHTLFVHFGHEETHRSDHDNGVG